MNVKTLFAALISLLVACNAAPTQEDLDLTRGGRVEVFSTTRVPASKTCGNPMQCL